MGTLHWAAIHSSAPKSVPLHGAVCVLLHGGVKVAAVALVGEKLDLPPAPEAPPPGHHTMRVHGLPVVVRLVEYTGLKASAAKFRDQSSVIELAVFLTQVTYLQSSANSPPSPIT